MAELALTAKEAAELLGVSPDEIRRMCERGILPHNRTGGRSKKGMGNILISRKGLEEWLMGETKKPVALVVEMTKRKPGRPTKTAKDYGIG